jgi:hypothetical protein
VCVHKSNSSMHNATSTTRSPITRHGGAKHRLQRRDAHFVGVRRDGGKQS